MKTVLGNQKGLALITTIMLLVLAFAVIAILLRLTTRQTQMAGLEQGYTTALDAAKAGTDMFITYAQNCATSYSNTSQPCGGLPAAFGTSTVNECLTVKLNNATFSKPGAQTLNWTQLPLWSTYGCSGTLTQVTDSNPVDHPDMTLTLNNYTINVKVIDTYIVGNTNPACPNGCYYYTAVARSQVNGSPEHVDVQFIYRYRVP
ncbi:MAG: hypothetical protein ACP5SH_17920 [Syntrophobacteraceae bacterium]